MVGRERRASTMSDVDTTIADLRSEIADFVHEREWERFHNPKDLASAITIEAAELMEIILWKGPQEVNQVMGQQEARDSIEEELADIVILCLSLANRMRIDIADAVTAKIASNEAKYPADQVRGRADKYTNYSRDP
jgi:NTP pyrophosphatase (non-canonical NTP hydrolase)